MQKWLDDNDILLYSTNNKIFVIDSVLKTNP